MKTVTLLVLVWIMGLATPAQAQKKKNKKAEDQPLIESIHFNLYTDSLKKGFYNYINVDGKMTDGSWMPLDSNHIIFTSNAGSFKGNDIFLDSSWKEETIKVKAVLRSNPRVWKEITIYIRKRGFDEALKTDQEILDNMRREINKKKKG